VLGDNVNLAARLEGANKEYDTSIMISEATWDLVAEKFVARELDRIRVVGKQKPVRIYELLASAGGALPVTRRSWRPTRRRWRPSRSGAGRSRSRRSRRRWS
jgi:adenylate cyclase